MRMKNKKHTILLSLFSLLILGLTALPGCSQETVPSTEAVIHHDSSVTKPHETVFNNSSAGQGLYPFPLSYNSYRDGNQLIGFVNESGQKIIPNQFVLASPIVSYNLPGQPENEPQVYGYVVAQGTDPDSRQAKALLGMDGQIKTAYKYADIIWGIGNLAKVVLYENENEVYLAGMLDLTSGEEVIKPAYQDIYPLTSDMFWVSQDGHNFVIDRQENVLFTLPDQCSLNFYQPPDKYLPQGLLSVNTYQSEFRQRCTLYNNQGRPILQYLLINYISPFREGVALIQEIGGRDWRLINSEGEYLEDVIPEQNFEFNAQGLAVVKTQAGYGLMNKDLQWIMKPSDQYFELILCPYTEAIIAKKDRPNITRDGPNLNQSYEVLDFKGRKLLEGKGFINNVAKDRFILESSDNSQPEVQLINGQGQALIPAGRYQSIYSFGEGLLMAHNYINNYEYADRKFDLLNTDGELLIDNCKNFYNVMTADKKFIYIQRGSYQGYIDKRGNWLYKETLYNNLED